MITTTNVDMTPGTADGGSDALAALHVRTVDTLTGYAKMVEKAEPGFRDIAEEFRALHARHADQLARMLIASGRESDPAGSFMGTVNRTVIATRAFFDQIDADLLTSIHDGEQHVMTAFATALEHSPTAENTIRLSEMRDELAALLARHQPTA